MHFNCNRKSQRFFKYILYDYLMTAQRAKMRKKCNVAFTWLGHCYIPSYFEFGSKGNFFRLVNPCISFLFLKALPILYLYATTTKICFGNCKNENSCNKQWVKNGKIVQ